MQQHIWELDIYGFTIIPSVLSDPEIKKLVTALEDVEFKAGNEQVTRGQTFVHVANLPTLDPTFIELIDHPKILPLLEYYLGDSMILGSLNSRNVRPGDMEDQDLHSDIPQLLLNSSSPVMMNTIWMLDDFTIENGATRVVPGSHKSGMDQPPKKMTIPYTVNAVGIAGSVLVINGQVWHAASANKTNAPRRALFGHYRKHMLLFQNDPHDGFPEKWFHLLNEKQRSLMRMQHGIDAPHSSDAHLR